MIKAMLPYLEPESQRVLGILVRIRELMLTINYFSKNRIQKLSFHSNDDMLNQIKKFCSPEMASSIDMMMKVLSMSDMMNMLSGFEGTSPDNAGMSDIMNLFGMMKGSDEKKHTEHTGHPPDFPMFNEHQQELFDSYMTQLDQIFEEKG